MLTQAQRPSGSTAGFSLARFALLVALALSCTLLGSAQAQQRVRKELRNLSAAEKQLLVQGINTMLTVGIDQGKATYGANYRDMSYFIVKHAVAANDPRGDQAHGQPSFMTFHRAFLLEFERAVLSVVPGLRALPYWDMTRDTRGGDLAGTPNYIFSAAWAGSLQGNANNGFVVQDGLFPFSPVKPFDSGRYGQYAGIWGGSRVTGLMRGSYSVNAQPYLTRYPADAALSTAQTIPAYRPVFHMDAGAYEYALNFDKTDFDFCTRLDYVPNWLEWSKCVDVSTAMASGQTLDDAGRMLQLTRASMFHPGPHWAIGGAGGDFPDTTASTLEPLIFFGHHANLDRNNMMWQQKLRDSGSPLATATNMYGFPRSRSEASWVRDGCFLFDVVSSNFPFTGLFPGQTGPATHYDVMYNTLPENVDYIYDTMSPTTSTPITTAPASSPPPPPRMSPPPPPPVYNTAPWTAPNGPPQPPVWSYPNTPPQPPVSTMTTPTTPTPTTAAPTVGDVDTTQPGWMQQWLSQQGKKLRKAL